MKETPSFKRRVIAFAVLLAAVILFNLSGYFIIYKKLAQNRSIEEAMMTLNDQELLSQQVVQTMVVLSIHNSFTPHQAYRQRQVLQQEISRFKSNHTMLNQMHGSINMRSLFAGKEVDSLFSEKRSYHDSIVHTAEAILKDTTGSYRSNHALAGQLRSNAYRLQQLQHSLIKNLRGVETTLESSIRYWSGALLGALVIALLFILLFITAPTMRLNRKTREEAGRMIRASEEKYGSLFQNIPLPVWVYDSKTLRFLEVNQKAIEHYGYSKAEFLSMKIMDIRPADEQERLEKILNYYREPGRMYKRGVWTHRKKNGEQIFVDVISHDTLYTNTRATLILANDITAQMDLQQQVISEKIARQRAIAKATIEVQERERNEIGRELHDNVNQVLTSARLHLDHMEQEGTDQHKHRTISMNLINTAINEIRRLSSSLVPAALTDVGLLASIEELLQQVNGLGLLKIRFVHTGINEEALDPGLALSLYRIVQEQTTNILKYAEATEATIALEQKGGDLCLELQDNGKGFDPTRPRKGVGLANIINRADVYQGTVDITAAPGKGCRLKVCFQLPPLEDGIL